MDLKYVDKNLMKRLKETTKSFNQKTLQLSKNRTSYIVPTKVNVTTTIKTVQNSKELLKEIQSMEKFINDKVVKTIRPNEKGVTITSYEYEKMQRLIKKSNAMKEFNNERYAKFLKMSDINQDKNELRMSYFSSPKFFSKYIYDLTKKSSDDYYDERAETYKENMLKSIDDLLGSKELIDLVSKIPAQKLVAMGLISPIANISFTSDPLPREDIVNAMKEELKNLNEELE